MDNSLETKWQRYVETPHIKSQPVKLDRILMERLKAFRKARKVKPYRIPR